MRDLAVNINFNFPFVITGMGIGEIIPLTGIKGGFVIINVKESTTGAVRPDLYPVSGIHAVTESDVSSTATHTRAKDDSVCAWESVEINPCSLCDLIFNVERFVVFHRHKITGCGEFKRLPEFTVNPFSTAVEFTFKSVFREVLSCVASTFVKWHVQDKPFE